MGFLRRLRPSTSGAPKALPPADAEAGMKEMGFLDHLEELRWALIKGFTGLIVTTVAAVFFRSWILEEVLLGPKKPDFFMYRLFGIEATEFVLQNRTITGQFFADWGTVLAVGAILGSPIFVYQLWRFIEPGLYPHEKSGARFAAFFATFFFALGIAFGYLVLTPIALQFFAGYSISPEIANEFDISKYFSMVTSWSLGAGLLFELPVVIYFLAKLGIATPKRLREFRRWALIIALVLGAIFSPPDPISQMIVATPLFFLYELSILIARGVERNRLKQLQGGAA